eukprot:m.259052 g.259052  ORF g.259052 m.259052 type:complete len:453 (+) comp19200_c0_seq10:62-1420(+)
MAAAAASTASDTLVADASSKAVLLAGFLEKSPPLNKLLSGVKAFKTRWFVLRSDSNLLKYYASPNTAVEPKGCLNMEDACRIEAGVKWVGPRKDKHRWVLLIELKSGRTFYLAAPSEETLHDWELHLKRRFRHILEKRNPLYFLLQSDDREGTWTLNTFLVCKDTPEVLLDIKPNMTAGQALAKAASLCRLPADVTATLCIMALDLVQGTCDAFGSDDFVLKPLPGHNSLGTFYLTRRDEAPFLMQLLRIDEAKNRLGHEYPNFPCDVRFYGSVLLDDDTDGASLVVITSHLSGDHAVQFHARKDGIKIAQQEQSVLELPYDTVFSIEVEDCNLYLVHSSLIEQLAAGSSQLRCLKFGFDTKAKASMVHRVISTNLEHKLDWAVAPARKAVCPQHTSAVADFLRAEQAIAKPKDPVQLADEDLVVTLRAAGIPVGASSLLSIEKYLDAEDEQ